MAAIEDGLRYGPVHIVKRNQPAAVVLTEDEYQRLVNGKTNVHTGMSAVQWLLVPPLVGAKDKAALDAGIRAERDAWGVE
jgi:hypothetical protein